MIPNDKKKKKFKPLGVLAGEVIGVISLSGVSQDVLNKYRKVKPSEENKTAPDNINYTEMKTLLDQKETNQTYEEKKTVDDKMNSTPEALFFDRMDNETDKKMLCLANREFVQEAYGGKTLYKRKQDDLEVCLECANEKKPGYCLVINSKVASTEAVQKAEDVKLKSDLDNKFRWALSEQHKDFSRVKNADVDITPNCPYADRAVGSAQCCNEKLCPYEKMIGKIYKLVDGYSCKISEFEEIVLKGEKK